MKTQFFTIVLIIISIAFLSNCTSADKKSEVQKKLQSSMDAAAKANLKLNLLMKDSVLQFKKESAEKTITYEKQLAAYKSRAAYNMKVTEKKIAELEQNNNDMKNRLSSYKDEGTANWELFKYELSRELDEQGKSIKVTKI